MATLYEEIFEGKQPKRCEDCAHFDLCEADSQIIGSDMDADTCDDYEEEGRTLYDDIFGKEEL